jgi:rRNA maturation RNase YbeY
MNRKRLMKIRVTKQAKAIHVHVARLQRLAAWLLRQASGRNWSALEILLTDDAGSVAANGAVFGRDYVTDVISLTYLPQPGEQGGVGELIINVELAVREGARRAGGPERELALYLAHGCDHLAGADDATPRQRRAMRRRERRWLRAAARAGLLRGLFSKGWKTKPAKVPRRGK